MEPTQKITAQLPKKLLKKAQRYTGLGITPTLRKGLELLAASDAYERILNLRGKIDLEIDLESLREDREC